jgi:hypothetical protein
VSETLCEFDMRGGAWTCRHCLRPVRSPADATPPKRSCPRAPMRAAPQVTADALTVSAEEFNAKLRSSQEFTQDEVSAAFVEESHNPLPLGDMVESVAKKVGADKLAKWYETWSGRDCGCDGRKRWLNAAGSWLSGNGWKADTPADLDEPSAPRPVAPIAVIIPAHNYGRFLEECITSVWNQTVQPAELIVVDDASTDDTAEVCERLGVKRIAVDYHNAHRSRGAGFAATTAEWVCFLDADDTIEPDYLAQAAARFTTGVGFVFSDVEQFGAASGRLVYQAGDISTRNFAHAGSVARRIALASAQVFDRTLPGEVLEDWWMWRRVLEAGWQPVKSPAIYRYRRHEGSRSKDLSTRDPVAVAGLALEDITIAIPLSGRRIWWPRMRGWLEQQTWPRQQTRLLFVDTSDDERFAANVRTWLANYGYPSTQYVAMRPADPGIADADRHQHAVYRGVQAAMPRIYNRVRQEVTTPYVLIVEDDILPPVDAAERLLKSFDQDTVSVSGAYRSRYQDNYIAWTKGLSPIARAGDGVEIVGGNGFGCVMLRSSVLKQTVLHHGGRAGDLDPNFYADIDPRWVAKLDWSVRCDHAGLAA